MQETILPLWRQGILQEQTAFPPRSAFMLEPRNDSDRKLEAESDLSSSLLPPTDEPVNVWQQRCQYKLVFAAKVFTLGIFLFAATALVANIAVMVGGIIINDSHQRDVPLMLTLSLDDDTAKKITPVDHLAQVFNIDPDDVEVAVFRWPEDRYQDNKDYDDGNDDVPSDISMQLHLSKNDGTDDGSTEGKNFWLRFSKPSNRETKYLRSSISYGEERQTLSPSTATVNSAFVDSEKVVESGWKDFLCDKIIEAFPETFQGAARRVCQLSHSEEIVTTKEENNNSTATVNSAVVDSEKATVSEWKDFFCDKIMEAFPETFQGAARRICQLPHSEEIVMTKKENNDSTATILGNDRDQYGCITSAGYSWCQTLNQCHRPWETVCESSDGNGHGGFVKDSLLGNDRDEYGCDRSAGYSWCETSNSCHRAWETSCGSDDNDNDNNGIDVLPIVKVA